MTASGMKAINGMLQTFRVVFAVPILLCAALLLLEFAPVQSRNLEVDAIFFQGDPPPPLTSESTCEDIVQWLPPETQAPVLVQVANKGYLTMELNFLLLMKKNSAYPMSNMFLLCLDEETKAALHGFGGIRCVDVDGVTAGDHFHHIWLFRTRVLTCLVGHGVDVLMSDNDALWVQDPLPDLSSIEGDVLIQRGSMPKKLGDRVYGVTMCMGFALFRAGGEGMKTLLDEMLKATLETNDDQIGLNTAAHRLGLTWDYTTDIRYGESTGIGRGVLSSLPGNFTVALLPNSQYTRNLEFTTISSDTIVAHCFPYNERISLMRHFGLWLLD